MPLILLIDLIPVSLRVAAESSEGIICSCSQVRSTQ